MSASEKQHRRYPRRYPLDMLEDEYSALKKAAVERGVPVSVLLRQCVRKLGGLPTLDGALDVATD